MPAQYYEATLTAPAAGAGTPYNTSTTLTDVSPAPQLILPANFLQVGSVLRVTAYGAFSVVSATTPTLLLGVYYGGVAGVLLAGIAATATASGVVGAPFRVEYTGVVRTVGSTGTIMGQGFVDFGTSASAVTHMPIPNAALATVSIDTTAAKAITVGAQWGTNNVGNTLTCHGFLVESMV